MEPGRGVAVLDGVRTDIAAEFAILIPAGTRHNITNTGDAPMKLYTLYSPPNQRDGVVHHTRAAVTADIEHFAGQTMVDRYGTRFNGQLPVSRAALFVEAQRTSTC